MFRRRRLAPNRGRFWQARRRFAGRLRGVPDPYALAEEGLVIGEGVYFGEDVLIDPAHCWLITIGDHVTFAPRVHVLAHDASTRRVLGYTRIACVTIEDDVFIGAASIVLPGVTIGQGAIIGAGSVVRHDVPPGALAVGNPARIVGQTEGYLERQRALLADSPKFSRAWTTKEGITRDMRDEMRRQLESCSGFVK